MGDGLSVLRVLRFDREGERRLMAISAASLLGTEYPGGPLETARWSYPRLAEELKRIGAPPQDLLELFNRMVFNAVVGNDDDHPRNHAAIYRPSEQRWRLAPAFDVVPNPDEHPKSLAMQLSLGRFDISREAALAGAVRFSFDNPDVAAIHLDTQLARMAAAFEQVAHRLTPELKTLMADRLRFNLQALSARRRT